MRYDEQQLQAVAMVVLHVHTAASIFTVSTDRKHYRYEKTSLCVCCFSPSWRQRDDLADLAWVDLAFRNAHPPVMPFSSAVQMMSPAGL